jgi:hypothetical protein
MTNNTGYHNTGNYNTGDHNTGTYNTGHYNTGHYNTGHCNTGHHNTGDHNTGDHNTGHYNTGYHNTGYHNTGHRNTGHYNTGHSNTGNRHVGSFNTVDAESAYYFNTLLPVAAWEAAYKPDWIYKPCPTTRVPLDAMRADAMRAKEKTDNPSCVTTGGYLRENDMAEEWRKAYASASPEDIQAVRDLPGFDPDVFFQITGLDLRVPDDEITIDGVVYVKKPNQ